VNPQQIAALSAFIEAAVGEIAQQDRLDAQLHDQLVELFSRSSGLAIKPDS
jgi:hypothetical protein